MKKNSLKLCRFSFVLVIMFGILIRPVFSTEIGILPDEALEFMERFYEHFNKEDYKTIFKDLATSRFRSSSNFEEFKTAMEKIYEQFGKIQDIEAQLILHDYHPPLDLDFYRIEYKVYRDKNDTIERIVLMEEKGTWLADGYGIATVDEVYFAQGNLYNFIKGRWIAPEEDEIWSSSKMDKVWKDTKREYIKKNWLKLFTDFIKGKKGKGDGSN